MRRSSLTLNRSGDPVLYLLLVASGALPLPRPSRGDGGATATEYALLIAFTSVLMYAGVLAFRNALAFYFAKQAADVATWAPAN